jgi:ribonucleoside-diphosphate reductase alpha chain
MTELLNYFKGDELAANVWQDKYAKTGEVTPDDMHKRMAKEFARIENLYQSKESENSNPIIWDSLSWYGRHRGRLDEESIFYLFKDFKYVIPQGSIMDILGSTKMGSLSNCFVIGQPYDSYGGIMLKDEEMVQLEKRRGGIGIDISTLRPSGTPTTNAAKTSTGAVSFMHRYSNTTREVAQNGRRGALMISIDINHPDVMDFIKIKRDLTQVTGANISIKLNKEFMEAVEKDEDYILRFPCDLDITKGFQEPLPYNTLEKISCLGEIGYVKKIKAKEYWDEIVKSAHNVAEPGLMFWDNMVNYAPDGVYPQYKPITTNPCSEIGMQEYDACRLIAVNLFSFVENPFTKEAKFDFDKFYKVNYEAMRLSDDLIDLEAEHIDRIIEKIMHDPEPYHIKERELDLWGKIRKTALSSRRTGLGFTALADTLAALGLKYDSEEALAEVEKIMQTKMESELNCTTDLAILRGTFEGWDEQKELFFIEQDGKKIEFGKYGNMFYAELYKNFPLQAKRMMQYGRRNVSWSTVAPTGTVSLMAQTSSGIEPIFMPFYMRRKKINPGQEGVRVDFVDQNGDTWQEFPVLHPKFKDWIIQNIDKELQKSTVKDKMDSAINIVENLDKDSIERWFKQSPWYGSTANDINWLQRVKMQSIIQKYITHSISSTINLPSDVTEEEVSKIYMESWKLGLKGITVYRDGSRSGVLVADNSVQKDEFGYNKAPKRPKELDAEYYFATSKGKKYAIIVGLFEGKPYEVFAFENPLSEENLVGKVIKEKKGSYKFVSPSYTIEHLELSSDSAEERVLTRWISLLLRHGANPKFVVEQTEKSEVPIVSFSKVLIRILKKYIPDGEVSTVACKSCGSTNTRFEEGCSKCLDCGDSKCA